MNNPLDQEVLAIQTVDLPYCWVCGSRFTSSVPPGPSLREDHHVIPRKAGGTDGPTFSICTVHHDKLHKIEKRLAANKPYYDLLVGETNPEHIRKILWLAVQARNGFAFAEGDPNKKVTTMVSLNRQHQAMIAKLKKLYPKAKSREAILKLGLLSLYARHFGNEDPDGN